MPPPGYGVTIWPTPNAAIDNAQAANMDVPQHLPPAEVRTSDEESAFGNRDRQRGRALRLPLLRALRWLPCGALAAHHLAAPGERVLGPGGHDAARAVSVDFPGRLGARASRNEAAAEHRIRRPFRRGRPLSAGPKRHRAGFRLPRGGHLVDRGGQKTRVTSGTSVSGRRESRSVRPIASTCPRPAKQASG